MRTTPRLYLAVMISSTFTDLKEHRAALIAAIDGEGLTHVAMENDSAKADVDVIDSSLRMVRDASAYALVIGRKYGQTPRGELSLTELEFDEAMRLKRPILLFIRGDQHLLREADIETDSGKRAKLNAFRERAKRKGPDSAVPYVHRYELNKARALLEKLGVTIPNLPPYDPAKDEKLPWEDDVAAAI